VIEGTKATRNPTDALDAEIAIGYLAQGRQLRRAIEMLQHAQLDQNPQVFPWLQWAGAKS